MARSKKLSRAQVLAEISERTAEIKALDAARTRRDELFRLGRSMDPPILFSQLADAAQVTSTAVQQAVNRK